MKEKAYVFDLMDTLVESPNLLELLVGDHPDLMTKFKTDPKTHQREVAQTVDQYLTDPRLQLDVYMDTIPALDRLRATGKIAVVSNGTGQAIKHIIEETRIAQHVDEAYSLEDFDNLGKDDPELYPRLQHKLSESGLSMVTYVDDKYKYCSAASDSRVVPRVYQIDRKGKFNDGENYVVIRSLDEVVFHDPSNGLPG